MEIPVESALYQAARTVISEYKSPTNTLAYRQILDKHAKKVAPMLPTKPPAWLQLNYVCHKVYAEK